MLYHQYPYLSEISVVMFSEMGERETLSLDLCFFSLTRAACAYKVKHAIAMCFHLNISPLVHTLFSSVTLLMYRVYIAVIDGRS